jgi:hypothetical protein
VKVPTIAPPHPMSFVWAAIARHINEAAHKGSRMTSCSACRPYWQAEEMEAAPFDPRPGRPARGRSRRGAGPQ